MKNFRSQFDVFCQRLDEQLSIQTQNESDFAGVSTCVWNLMVDKMSELWFVFVILSY